MSLVLALRTILTATILALVVFGTVGSVADLHPHETSQIAEHQMPLDTLETLDQSGVCHGGVWCSAHGLPDWRSTYIVRSFAQIGHATPTNSLHDFYTPGLDPPPPKYLS